MQENTYIYSDEITLKELILKLKYFVSEVIKSWLIIVTFCMVSVIAFVYKHYCFEPTFKAELRFVVEGQSNSSGGLSSLLGSFGIKKGGKVNPYKIIEVGKSMDILMELLSQNVEPEGNIANAILREYDLITMWSETNSEFENFKFKEEISSSGSEVERNVIKRLRAMIWGDKKVIPLTNFELEEDTGIYTISTIAKNEQISIWITNTLYEKIKYFFEEEIFLNQKQLADILTMKADSIKTLNESKIRQLAKFEDSNRGVVSNQIRVTSRILSQESSALSFAYAEIIKNKEMTDVNLKDIQPLFMAIDTPFSPISPTVSTALIEIVKGIILGGFIAVIFVLARRILRDAMQEND
ncbi:MAG: hypothetical protein P8H42_03695 [Saprospiraceae bacterium]|nr:hypothetical protein [Saprospiraceae bacterium]